MDVEAVSHGSLSVYHMVYTWSNKEIDIDIAIGQMISENMKWR